MINFYSFVSLQFWNLVFPAMEWIDSGSTVHRLKWPITASTVGSLHDNQPLSSNRVILSINFTNYLNQNSGKKSIQQQKKYH